MTTFPPNRITDYDPVTSPANLVLIAEDVTNPADSQTVKITSDNFRGTAAGRALADAADATAQRTALGLGSAATQAYATGVWTPAFLFLETVTYVTQTGRFKRLGGLVYWEAFLEWTGGDTADSSGLTINLAGVNTAHAITNLGFGLCQHNSDASTGLVLVSTSTGRFTYRSGFTQVRLTNAAGAGIGYNTGEFKASGTLYLSGVYATAE